MSRPFSAWILVIHKWIGICLGIIVAIWLITGMVMILPHRSLVSNDFNLPTDLASASVSPAQARAAATPDSAASGRVTVVGVARHAIYQVEVGTRERRLIDSRTGLPLEITREVAESLAREALGFAKTALSGATLLERHSLRYPRGPLPVHELSFDDGAGTRAYVALSDGAVSADDRGTRTQRFFGQLHSFDQIRQLTGSRVAKVASLHVTSLIGLVLLLTGYVLTLPRRWLPGRRSAPSKPGPAA